MTPVFATLLCLGTAPGFMLSVAGEVARFDYLGDGSFAFRPAPAPGRGYSEHVLVTRRIALDVYLSERPCRALGATLPLAVEIGVPSAAGILPYRGCCLWRDE